MIANQISSESEIVLLVERPAVAKVGVVGMRKQRCQRAVAVEAPGPSFLDDFGVGLPVPVERLVADLAPRVLVRQLDGVGSEPLDVDHRDGSAREEDRHPAPLPPPLAGTVASYGPEIQ